MTNLEALEILFPPAIDEVLETIDHLKGTPIHESLVAIARGAYEIEKQNGKSDEDAALAALDKLSDSILKGMKKDLEDAAGRIYAQSMQSGLNRIYRLKVR